MTTPTYTLIDTRTLSVAASEVEFLTIDQSFADLVLVVDGKAQIKTGLYLQFNGDSGSNYTTVGMQGEPSGDSSYSQTLAFTNANLMGGAQGLNTVQIMDYSASDHHKTILGRADVATEQVRAAAARWASTAAIYQVRLFLDSTRNFQIGTTLNLYGIE
jgi:hypothetical protein